MYDLFTKWTNQQFIVNAQQQQDNPKHWQQGWGEYLLPTHPSFIGTVNPAQTYAAFIANSKSRACVTASTACWATSTWRASRPGPR